MGYELFSETMWLIFLDSLIEHHALLNDLFFFFFFFFYTFHAYADLLNNEKQTHCAWRKRINVYAKASIKKPCTNQTQLVVFN